jgi:hypothetical protein
MRGDPAAKLVPVVDGKNFILDQPQPASAVLPFQAAQEWIVNGTIVFLGLDREGSPVFGAACKAESKHDITALAGQGMAGVGCGSPPLYTDMPHSTF